MWKFYRQGRAIGTALMLSLMLLALYFAEDCEPTGALYKTPQPETIYYAVLIAIQDWEQTDQEWVNTHCDPKICSDPEAIKSFVKKSLPHGTSRLADCLEDGGIRVLEEQETTQEFNYDSGGQRTAWLLLDCGEDKERLRVSARCPKKDGEWTITDLEWVQTH